jgi:glucokinase
MSSRSSVPPVIGIDLGGTKILVGVVDRNNEILGRAKCSTPAKDGGPAIVEAMKRTVDEALVQAGLTIANIAGAAIGAPGPLDPDTGTILWSSNLNVENFPIAPQLSAAIGRPVALRNDVRMGGYAEFRLGAARGFQDVIAVFVGTGIGGCLIQKGEVIAGTTGNAGELGHMIVKAGGPQCGCGARGCMEALASKTAIARRIEKAVRKGLPTVLADKMAKKGGRLKSGDLADAVAAKDLVALTEVQRSAHFLGIGMGSLINVFGPQIVVVGGGVAGALGEHYIELVRIAARTQILTDPDEVIRIERAALGDNAGILGAALVARDQIAGT